MNVSSGGRNGRGLEATPVSPTTTSFLVIKSLSLLILFD